MKCDANRVIADTTQIHPRTKRERPVLVHRRVEAPGVSVSGMAAALFPRLFPSANLERCQLDEGQFVYAIIVLECHDDVIHAPRNGPRFVVMGNYDNGQRWPDAQFLPYWCGGSAIKSQT
jgi:hypothetical protein